MNTKEVEKRNTILSQIAQQLKKLFPGWFGSVKFNIKDGEPININIEESLLCKKERDHDYKETVIERNPGA